MYIINRAVMSSSKLSFLIRSYNVRGLYIDFRTDIWGFCGIGVGQRENTLKLWKKVIPIAR